MVNISFVSFYDNVGLIFKGSKDTATKCIKIGLFRPTHCHWRLLARDF